MATQPQSKWWQKFAEDVGSPGDPRPNAEITPPKGYRLIKPPKGYTPLPRDPYAEFQAPAAKSTVDPYAEFQRPVKNGETFVPPSPSSWQGPAPVKRDSGFTAPPPSSWQGPAPDYDLLAKQAGALSLTEDRRQQLDGIVQQMMANKESDADILTVVNDFKTKYSGVPSASSGGDVDYDALAKQAGAISSKPATDDPFAKYQQPASKRSAGDDPFAKYQQPASKRSAGDDPFAKYQVPASEEPPPDAMSRFTSNFVANLNPFPALKHYLLDISQQDQQDIERKLDNRDYGGALATIVRQSFPGSSLIPDIAHNQAHQLVKAYQDLHNSREMPNLSDRMLSASGHALAGAIPVVGPAAANAGEQIGSGDVAGGLGSAAGLVSGVLGPDIVAAVKPMARSAANAGTEVLGHTTGTGGTVMRQALREPTAGLVDAMRGNLSDQEVLAHAKDALQNVKDARASEYRAALAKMPSGNVDLTPLRQTTAAELQKFNILRGPDGTLDFSRSTIRDPGAQADVKSIVDDVYSWGQKPGDTQPLMVDTLKRRIDDTYSPSSTARSIIQSVKASARDALNTQVRGYADMTSGYAKASEFLDNLRDLSLDSKNPGTAIRKLSTVLKQNNGYRELLVNELGKYAGPDLRGELAGLRLNAWGPRGVSGPVSGAGLLTAIATGVLTPKAAFAAAMASPRLMGELMVAMNKTRPAFAKTGQVIRANGAAGAQSSGPPQEIMDSLPSGIHTFRNGQVWRKDAAGNVVQIQDTQDPRQAYVAGHTYGGMKFLGGDPNNQQNWLSAR